MTCRMHGDSAINCGNGRQACSDCDRLYDNEALWRYLGPKWQCPVCDRSRGECQRVVIHHDHFVDAVWQAVPVDKRLQLQAFKLETFQRSVICERCNALCAIAKHQMPKLPRWFSLSPDEMRVVREDDGICNLVAVASIWDTKRVGIFAEKLTSLVALGVEREAIKRALSRYRPAQTKHEVSDDTKAICVQDPAFKQRFRSPGNDLWLVQYLHARGWTMNRIDSFVHLYHRRHGDRQMQQIPSDMGRGQFINWLVMSCENPDAAEAYRKRCAYWRNKGTGTEG